MATAIPSSSLQLSTPFSSPSPRNSHAPKPYLPFPARATDPDTPPSEAASAATGSGSEPEGDQFESRLSQVRLRYRSGTGKKAEARKVKKSNRGSSPPGTGGMYLPPVALQEPASEGLKVEFGFTPYSERMNGRVAILGLTALLLVELATGKSVISYHTPAILLIQVYSVAAVAALYAKYEKERTSVWPQSPDK